LFDPFVLPPLALMLEATRDSGGELERPAVGKCIDVLLGLGLVQLVLGLNLSHEVVLAFERSDIGRTELRPFSRDLRAHTNRVLCVGDVLGHVETPKKFHRKRTIRTRFIQTIQLNTWAFAQHFARIIAIFIENNSADVFATT
jgi:hypothetical protein